MHKERMGGLLRLTVSKWVPLYPSRMTALVTPGICTYTLNHLTFSRFTEHLLCARCWGRKITQVLVLEKLIDW